ncbi:hypothetical protein IU510_15445 [Nocardia cyriacigeorgica]|uniref:DUF6779 domain-containing protein n=1 Tax=Nocardia cyriacigeorgica TaxID=135487 RepID=UPI00189495D7|nr:DUF6779 domain-containing protein [Nocardia cyriacigeorgica]MBF6099473.1 hypothetical protein [Nocardia cyriacigeorgica]MBF6160201.1 hypothetical protein [Nocardia cyriacigeorgica]MBF6199285.1 hypothetical protein [Nocardia cyriacigeorgica]MBF6319225.1 hypothetical protein [Nocardia cyriacigeorgica]MBF6535405.1 hypothetical protein [Nocardia cyriacigeorgica]
MVSPSRTSSSPRRRDYAGKLFIGALILLGLVASIFLIFSDSVQFIRIGLVAALWAAVLGALAATKYRKESTVDKAKVRDLQKVYELQLDREISARREYELGVEARVRQEVGADAAEMAALRAELTVLRQSLQRLFDGDLPMDRPALHADAVRVQELTGRPAGSANVNSSNADGWAGPQLPRDSVTPVYDTDHPQPPVFASPFDDPVTAETSIITLDHDEDGAAESSGANGKPVDPFGATTGWADAFSETPAEPDDADAPWVASAAAGQSPLVGPPAPGEVYGQPFVGPPAPDASTWSSERLPAWSDSAAAPSSQASAEPSSAGVSPAGSTVSSAGSTASQASSTGTAGTTASAASETPTAASAPAADSGSSTSDSPAPPSPARSASTAPTFGSASSRRRRRAESESGDSSSKRLSVAEIMANLQSEQSNRPS